MLKVENLIVILFYKGFLTGGAGFVCSNTCLELLNSGMDVTEFDNFCNSHPLALARLEQAAGKNPTLVQGDIRYCAAWELLCITAVNSILYTLLGLSQWVSWCKSRWPITKQCGRLL